MGYKLVRIDYDTDEKIKECVKDFIAHNPKFEKICISYNKILHEIAKFYLKN